MISFSAKLQAVKSHFEFNDLSLGYRKLIDCVLDAQEPEFYREIIDIENQIEINGHDSIEQSRLNALIEKLSQVEVQNNVSQNPILKAESITKSFGKDGFGLGPVSLKIAYGDLIGLVGENGNGKTTLMRILAMELTKDSGEIEFEFQKDYNNLFDLRTKITYIPQRTPTWYGKLVDNLKYAATHYGTKPELNELMVNMMIIRFGLWKYRKHKWSELSSGYKMRFELARNFLRAPKIMLLDEPLANLDILAQQLILEDLKNLSQSISNPVGILLSSQQLFEVEKVSDEVIFLKEGRPTHLKEAFEAVSHENAIEIETIASRETLQQAFNQMENIQISFNGGMYQVHFSSQYSGEDILSKLIEHKIPIGYYRNISKSTKRLFVH
ncbi:MAG: ABC transporter ATP-binding protein [Chitinophagales bacterium]|jgi:ABC-2 type transport system ATP-binding protein|nr:ABC transporter ATP-binding protein [Chitinophagales bacterium]